MLSSDMHQHFTHRCKQGPLTPALITFFSILNSLRWNVCYCNPPGAAALVALGFKVVCVDYWHGSPRLSKQTTYKVIGIGYSRCSATANDRGIT